MNEQGKAFKCGKCGALMNASEAGSHMVACDAAREAATEYQVKIVNESGRPPNEREWDALNGYRGFLAGAEWQSSRQSEKLRIAVVALNRIANPYKGDVVLGTFELDNYAERIPYFVAYEALAKLRSTEGESDAKEGE